MRYLYGDSSPFPLADNFLVTLCAATEACAELLRADDVAGRSREAVRMAEERTAQELSRLEETTRAIEAALRPRLPVRGRPWHATRVAERMLETSRQLVETAQAEILAWRDGAVTAAAAAADPQAVHAALSGFLGRHQLPGTVWNLQWVAGFGKSGARAEVYASAPCALEATFDVAIPPDHLWARPVAVASLERRATIQMMKEGWIRRARMRDEHLHKLHVTCVIHTREIDRLVLSTSAKAPSAGVELTLRAPDSQDVTVIRRDAAGAPDGERAVLSPADAAIARRIWSRVEATIRDLVCFRTALKGASLRGVPVEQVVHPAAIAESMIDLLAPLVNEVRRRTATPGEFALKRFVGDGRREEIFIPYEAVTEHFARLAPHQRMVFDAFGLEEEARTAVIHTLHPRQADARRIGPTLRLASSA